jgi:hypothetical protein
LLMAILFFSRLNFFWNLFPCVLQGCNNMQQQSSTHKLPLFFFSSGFAHFLKNKVLVHGILFLFTNASST